MSRLHLNVALYAAGLLLGSNTVLAATYYLATSGNDSNSCATAQSAGTPKKTFGSAWGCLSGGSTLMVADGTYTGASPPSGKAGAAGSVITVQAAHDGAAVLSGSLSLVNNAYLEFDGFKVTSSSSSVYAQSAGSGKPTHHITFRRNGFTTTTTDADGGVILADGTHHMLFEDFWIWGGGRYSLMCYGGPGGSPPNTTCDSNTFRRGVIRQGPSQSASGDPQASMSLYYSSNNIVENVIALDGNQKSDSSNSAFYMTAHSPPPSVSNNKYFGVIALNNKGVAWYVDADNGATSSNNELHNSVLWDSDDYGIVVYNGGGSCTGNLVDHVTIGVTHGNDAIASYCGGTKVTSSILMQAAASGINGDFSVADYNDVYGNRTAYNGLGAGAHDISANPQLKYIIRIEANSPCQGAGQNGTDCGANVEFRYVDGVQTTQALWPWPNEARIRKEMCVDTGITTGFCAASSLTNYVWGYLGNARVVPNPPSGVTVN